jgi:nitrogen regulatory protein P-II 2
MKLIIAYIQPEKLADVKKKLFDAEVFKVSVIPNALGAGQQKGYTEEYRGVIREVNLRMKVRLEIAVNEDFVERTIDAIISGARTGNIGDGKIFVVSLDECVRIRTGERGQAAIG